MDYRLNKGVTLLEAIFVMAILAILATVTFAAFSRSNTSQALEGAARTTVAVLNDARARTLASRGDDQYGVRFESDRVILFAGSSYDVDDPANEVTRLPSRVSITNISLSGGGSDLSFSRLSGVSSANGSVTLTADAEGSPVRTIVISETGLAYEE